MGARRKGTWTDLALVGGLAVAVLALVWFADLEGLLAGRPVASPGLDLTESLVLLLFAVAGFTYYALRRAQELRREGHRRGRAETILREASDLVQSLVEAQRKIAQDPDAVDDFLQTTVDHATRLVEADGGALLTVRGGDLECRAAAGTLAPYRGGRSRVEASPGHGLLDRGDELYIPDLAARTPPGPFPLGASHVRSYLALPLRVDGHSLGLLEMTADRADAFGTAEADALGPVGQFVAHTLWHASDYKSKRTLVEEHRKATQELAQTQRWLDALASRLDEILWVTDADRTETVFVNAAFSAVFGRDADDLYQHTQTWYEAIHPDDRPGVVEAAAAAEETGGYDLEYRITDADGATRWLTESCRPVNDEATDQTVLVSVVRDATDIWRAQHEAQTLRRRLAYAYEAGPVVAYAASPGGDYGLTFVSPNAESILGYRPADMTGDPNFWTARLHPEEQPKVMARLAKLFEKGTLSQEYRFRNATGEWRTLRDTARLVRDEDGEPLEIVGFWRDVTDRKRAEEGLEYSLNRVKELQDSRTQMLNNIAHDLASPLSPITLQLTILEKKADDLPEPVQKGLQVIGRNANQVKLLVQDLKDIARMEAGKLKLQKEPVDLKDLVVDAVGSFEQSYKEEGVTLSLEADQSLPVEADTQRLTQVLYNYLTNALKFTPAKGTVRVAAAADGGSARVTVTDSGRGLSPEESGKLFQPFSQVHNPKEVKEKGTGLGLYICKGIVEEHGGRVWVDSAGRGEGSTFGYTVPLRDA